MTVMLSENEATHKIPTVAHVAENDLLSAIRAALEKAGAT